MSNAGPIQLNVATSPSNALSAPVSVQNLAPANRQIVWAGTGDSDLVELWGSLDGEKFYKVDTLSAVRSGKVITEGSRFYSTVRVVGSGLALLTVGGEDVGFGIAQDANAWTASNVGPATNVPDLSAFPVAGNDGQTNTVGQVVLLYAQTNPLQNGPYVVGQVAAGVAALTRPSWWAAGLTMPIGRTIAVGAGTRFGGSVWKSFVPAPFQVGAADPQLFPINVTESVTLNAGTASITDVPVRANARVNNRRTTPVGTALTVEYNPVTLTPGAGSAPGTVVMNAQLAAGTINAADGSTLFVEIANG